MENIWFDQIFKMLDNSLELLKKEKEEIDDDGRNVLSCARCRIYQRKKQTDTHLLKKIKHIYRIHNEHNYSTTSFTIFYSRFLSKGYLLISLSSLLRI